MGREGADAGLKPRRDGDLALQKQRSHNCIVASAPDCCDLRSGVGLGLLKVEAAILYEVFVRRYIYGMCKSSARENEAQWI